MSRSRLNPIGEVIQPIVDPELEEFCVLPDNYKSFPQLYVFDEAQKFDQSLLEVLEEMTEGQLRARRTQQVFYDDRLDDVVDICIDGSFRNKNSKGGGRGGYGGVFFDSTGRVIAIFWGRSVYLKDNDFHEVEAVEQAMIFAQSLCLRKIRIRIDNKGMCEEIVSKLAAAEKINDGWIVVERKSKTKDTIKHIVELRQNNWKGLNFQIVPIPREINYPADFLSRVVPRWEREDTCRKHIVANDHDPYEGLTFGQCLATLVARAVYGYGLKFWGNYQFLQDKRTAVGAAAGRVQLGG